MICFKYFGFRPRISSNDRSSGGCIIFEVIPCGTAATAGDLLCSWPELPAAAAAADVPGLLVVGGALMVALLHSSISGMK